jgi:sulfite reductase (ferredoxin)
MCSHLAGVCADEVFDPTPHSKAIAKFFLRNPMCQNLPRKFKINFSCCEKHGLIKIADIGLVPTLKDGIKGFKIYLGGGLGAASFIGHLLEQFTEENKLLPTCMAVVRLFDRQGNRENMARNRMRYLVHEMGWDKFQKMVIKERAVVEMTTSFKTSTTFSTGEFELKLTPSAISNSNRKLHVLNELDKSSPAYQRWIHTNVITQRQEGYYVVFVTLGAGDITSHQLRSLAKIIRDYSCEGTARNTPNQNFAIRYVKGIDLLDTYNDLAKVGLANPGALSIASSVGCSGTTSCNLAITNSHRLAKEIQLKFIQLGLDSDEDLKDSTIKISGCPNSCGQHEIATIGFYGGASRIGGFMAPTYTMSFAGNSGENAELGKNVMRVPAKRVISTVLKIIEIYKQEKESKEKLDEWLRRVSNSRGSNKIKTLDDIKLALSSVVSLPEPAQDPDAYQDYGSDAKFIAKTARGECAA